MIVHFGKNFKYSFYPLTSDGKGYEILPKNPLAVYLYDFLPDRIKALAGTEAKAVLTANWASTLDEYGKIVDVPAILDPEPESNTTERKYYLVLVFETENQAGQHLLIREIKLRRVQAHEAILQASIKDVLTVEPSLTKFCCCVGDLEAYLDASIEELRQDMSACCHGWRELYDPSVLKPALIYLTISKYYYGLSRNPNDIYFINGERYYKMFETRKKNIMVEFDKNQDGNNETKKQFGRSSSFRIRR